MPRVDRSEGKRPKRTITIINTHPNIGMLPRRNSRKCDYPRRWTLRTKPVLDLRALPDNHWELNNAPSAPR
jgi:hypothetical protein